MGQRYWLIQYVSIFRKKGSITLWVFLKIKNTKRSLIRCLHLSGCDHGRDTGQSACTACGRTGRSMEKEKADVTFEKKIENAVRKSLEKAKKDDVILAFGSLSFLGEIVKALDTIRSEV